MAKFSHTGEIVRTAPSAAGSMAQRKRATGGRRFQYFLTGRDEMGRTAGQGAKTLGMLTNIATLGLGTIGAKRNTRGTVGGAKGIKDINKSRAESLKTAAEIGLTVLSFGGYGAIAAGTKAASAAAKGATGLAKVGAAAKGFKAGTAAFKAGSAAAGSTLASTVGTATAPGITTQVGSVGKEVGIQGGSALTNALNFSATGGKELTAKAMEKTAQAGVKNLTMSTVGSAAIKAPTVTSAAVSPFAQNMAKIGEKIGGEIGGDSGKLVSDFITQAGGKGKMSMKDFTKEFMKANKQRIKDAGIENAQKLLDKAWAKYEEQNPDNDFSFSQQAKQEEREIVDYMDEDIKTPRYERGGLVAEYAKGGMLKGKRHKDGGIKATVGKSKAPIEMEGGERVFSRKDTKEMDKLAEGGNATALGKKYMEAKAKHDKQGSDGFAATGEKVKEKGEFDAFKNGIHNIESSGKWKDDPYKAVNDTSSAAGKYQFLWSIWEDDIKDSTGVATKEEFLDNPQAQEDFMDKHIKENLIPAAKRIRAEYPEKTKGYSDEELMAMTHFQGEGGAKTFLSTGKDQGGENVEVSKYISKFNEGFKDSGGKHNTTASLTFENEDYQKKYDMWKSGQKYNIPEVANFTKAVNSFREGKQNEQKETAKASREVKIDKVELAKLSKAYESGKVIPGYKDTNAMVKKMGELESRIRKNQFDLINKEQVTAENIRKNLIPKMEAARAALNDKYRAGEIGESMYELNIGKLDDYQSRVGSYLDRADAAKESVDNYNQVLEEARENNQVLNVDGVEIVLADQNSPDIYWSQQLDLNKEFDKTFGIKSRTKLDQYGNQIDEFEYEDVDASIDLTAGANYTAEEAKYFEKYEKEYTKQSEFAQKTKRSLEEIADVESDIQADEDVPLSISDEELKAYLDRRKVAEEKTGLSSIIDKYGGMDTVLQMAGMAAAYKSAVEPLPEQKKSQQWKDHMHTMKARAQTGLANESMTLMQRQAERTYATDVSNIGRMATSGQAALGALGQASERKYAADMTMAVKDAEARAQNFREYGSALAADEQMTQQYWERNVYDQAARKRDLKSGLIGQAVSNVRDQVMFNQQYGDGSQYSALMQEMVKEKELANQNLMMSQLDAMGATDEQKKKVLSGQMSQLGIDNQ